MTMQTMPVARSKGHAGLKCATCQHAFSSHDITFDNSKKKLVGLAKCRTCGEKGCCLE